eukprot:TRINITY_DN7655_c0_g1_i1.p2 TRINITY_DN7655_c0_g1~~TRINITY_DN7655_c0_g1_i1.p2  ORF type:complete len:102 (-),score=13.79 TRINITY_DN7655_c0_g1_i1:64-369(-)
MTKGTFSMGRRQKTKSHCACLRCGKHSYHKQTQTCAACGYPGAKLRKYNWSEKAQRRRTQGTGRMRHMKLIFRKGSNGFREGHVQPARKRGTGKPAPTISQ